MSGSCSICSKCQSCQSFCQLGKQLVSDWYPVNTIIGDTGKDQIIIKAFTQSDLNTIANYLVQAAKKGSQYHTGDPSWSDTSKLFIYADDINALRGVMASGFLGGNIAGVSKDQVITSAWFTNLKQIMNSISLSPIACDQCNTACDSCISCQHSSCHSSCHGSH